ncbi:plasmid recombination protein, partial [Methanobrevibacter gottschalkii]|uniref:plasmid recombination protein n=1 Tax=Methanobrevibacter gottschalkii TaxID=190974 RepID=UPI0038D1BCAA
MPTEKNMSCARVQTYSSAKIGACERHVERKNKDYGNVNVEPYRIPMNVHFKDPGEKSYMDILRKMEEAGEVSRKGLRADAVLFDEVIFDVNTMYFEDHGGYEYAKKFYAEAYHYTCEKFGERNIISAVMHANEINMAASDDLDKPVYHYHMHLVAIPVVEKEVRWSKRCKDPALVGTVKEVVHQISHSKKWSSTEPMYDDRGNQIFRANGKPKYRASYSILQDEFFLHMTGHGFTGFDRGMRGSPVEHLSSLQYQIKKDTQRLADIEQKTKEAELVYEPAKAIHKTYLEIEEAGKKSSITGKYSVSKEDYEQLTALAKEGISSRGEINRLQESERYYRGLYYDAKNALGTLQKKYEQLKEKCKPFLDALEHFPTVVQQFIDTVRDLLFRKAAAEKAER